MTGPGPATGPGASLGDVQDLTSNLTGLSGLLSGHDTLERTLERIAGFAVGAIPGAEGAGLTLLEPHTRQTVVATNAFVRAVDDVQYSLGEGPCLSAVADGMVHTSGNLGGARQWPRFGPAAGRLGVHSALSIPLLLGDAVLGALNVYGRKRDAFPAQAADLGRAFSGPAAASVYNAQLLAQAERHTSHLQAALTSRATIDQALGVIMSRSGVTAEEAFGLLRTMSQEQSVKLSVVAEHLLDQAVRRARARAAHPPA